MTPYQLARRLERMADDVEELCQELADESLDLIQYGFKNEVDPRGVAWAPTRSGKGYRVGKRRKVGMRILHESGRLEQSFTILGVNRNGFAIGSDVEYGGFHQSGTRFMPRRSMVPSRDRGLGAWAEPLQETARGWIKKKLGG